nr:tetratricopeptide repeat protein [Rickettsia endosymbiont of Ceutorhynchus assimilis]
MPYKYLAIGVLIILIAALYFRNYLPFSSFFDNQPPPTLNKYEEELKAENKVIELNPNDVKAHYNRGNKFIRIG